MNKIIENWFDSLYDMWRHHLGWTPHTVSSVPFCRNPIEALLYAVYVYIVTERCT